MKWDGALAQIVNRYINKLVGSVTHPVQELRDFQRIHLKKGETKTVEFTITPDILQFYGPDMKRIVESGEFEVLVGKSSVEFLFETFEIIE